MLPLCKWPGIVKCSNFFTREFKTLILHVNKITEY